MRGNFDKDFNRMSRTILIMWVFNLILVLVVLGFIGWVIVQLLQYFGVI